MAISIEIESIHDWLEGFSQAVRDRNYESGRGFFAEDVVSFGSVAKRCDGLQSLEKNQWRNVWDVTSGFVFDLDSAIVGVEGKMAWAACAWQSQGKSATGGPLVRRGRCTFAFKMVQNRWLAAHSHFSFEPNS